MKADVWCRGFPDRLEQTLQIYKGEQMEKWRCPCGYTYEPEQGDLDNDIPVGTAWEAMPEDWSCPLCGAPRDTFFKTEYA